MFLEELLTKMSNIAKRIDILENNIPVSIIVTASGNFHLIYSLTDRCKAFKTIEELTQYLEDKLSKFD